MKFCTKCGAQNEDGLAFCSSCGASLNGGATGTTGEKKPFNVLALIGMIAGILGLVWCWWSFLAIFGVIFGIAGVIMSQIARKKDPTNGMAKAGFICGLIAAILGLIFFVACGVAPCICYGSALSSYGYYY